MNMQKEKKRVPELRFEGFEGEWEEKTLSELLEFKNGINASKDDYGSGYKFINVLDIIENDFITYNKIIGSVNVSKDIYERNLVQYGDILFQRSSETRKEVGQSNVYLDKEHNSTFGGFVIRGKKIGEYIPYFLHMLLKTSIARKEITTKSGGSTRYNIGQDVLSSVKLPFPILEEQKKIAAIFTNIYSRIQHLKHKKTLLEEYKKGVMQKIFSQEIRFKPALSGAEVDEMGKEFPKWERRRLGEIANVYQPKTISQSDLTTDGYDVYGANGIIGKYREYNHQLEQIAITCRGNTCGTVNFTKPKSWITGNAMVINVDESKTIYKRFLYYLLFNTNFTYLISGSGQPQITGNIKKHSLRLPNIEEQTKIAHFLSALDSKIAVMDGQIEKTMEWKKGLLQKMFV